MDKLTTVKTVSYGGGGAGAGSKGDMWKVFNWGWLYTETGSTVLYSPFNFYAYKFWYIVDKSNKLPT